MTPNDLCADSDDIKSRKVTFVLSPDQWNSFRVSSKLRSGWNEVTLSPTQKNRVPNKSGIYTIILDPNVARHPHSGYVMYVGQTIDLKRRFGEYVGVEKRKVKRARVNRLLNTYDNFLRFVFIEADTSDLDDVEDGFLRAHIPPCCDDDELPADIRKAKKASF